MRGIGTETRCWNGEGFREGWSEPGRGSLSTLPSSFSIMHFESRLSINLGISFLFESGFHTLFRNAPYSCCSSNLKILWFYYAIIACTGHEFIYLHLSCYLLFVYPISLSWYFVQSYLNLVNLFHPVNKNPSFPVVSYLLCSLQTSLSYILCMSQFTSTACIYTSRSLFL